MPKITITIFPPQNLDIAPEIKGRKRRQKIGNKLYDVMTELMFESSDYHQTLFSSLIDARSMQGPRFEIMEDIEREPITYSQFIARCFILGGLMAKKTQPAETVGILLPNMISTVTTFFALQAYCRIPAMLNYSTGSHNVFIACKTARVSIVYSSRKFIQLAKLTEMLAELEKANITVIYLEDCVPEIYFFDKLKGTLLSRWPRLGYKLINSSRSTRQLLLSDTPAVVLFTSGSEGTPKGVVLSHANIQANRYQLTACVDFTSTDKVFNALPIFHSFGLTGGILLPLLSGLKLFLYPSPLHYRIIPELSYDTDATIFFGTDTFYPVMQNMRINMIFIVCDMPLQVLKNSKRKHTRYGHKNLV